MFGVASEEGDAELKFPSLSLGPNDRSHHGPDQGPSEDEPALPPGCEEQPKLRHRRLPAC